MKNAIKKAMEGGWNPNKIQMTPDNIKYMIRALTYERDDYPFLLDPIFWQCLGKQQGWPEHNHLKRWGEEVNSWYAQMHNFIDHIAVGGSINEFFNNLIK